MCAITDETAYHEAGHAVIAFACGIDVPKLSVLQCDCYNGGCMIDGEIGFLTSADNNLQLAQIRIIAFFQAGVQAQRKYLFDEDLKVDEQNLLLSGKDDHDRIQDKLELMAENKEPLPDLNWLAGQVDLYLDTPDVWSCVKLLAAKLVETKEMVDLKAGEYTLPPFCPVSAD